jgi:hypothetical protein
MAHDGALAAKNVVAIQKELESIDLPRFKEWMLQEIRRGRTIEEIQSDPESVRLIEYWSKKKQLIFNKLLHIAKVWTDDGRLSINFDGRLLSEN